VESADTGDFCITKSAPREIFGVELPKFGETP